jgi:predicted phage terminase large subunit-like protein
VLTRAGETSFANSGTGTREGVAFGSLTSQRGDRLIIDDPHSTETAESPAERLTTTRKFREGATDRLNDLEKSAIVVIMQRLHADDVSGTILKLQLPYVHLCLPMEFEPKTRCVTKIGFADPRENDGDLLDPVRFPRQAVEDLKHVKGSYAYAGQYQQRPTPREGGLFKRHWFEGKIIGAAPQGMRWVRHWDLAATKSTTAARTAGVKIGKTPDGRYVVGHVVKTQEEGNAVRKLIKATAEVDGTEVEISLPQDPGQAGKVQKSDMVAMLAGWTVRAEPETGDKYTRAEPFSVQCEAGNVFLVEGEWNADYLDELCLFPGGTFKDQVDASSGAFGRLVTRSSDGEIGVPVSVANTTPGNIGAPHLGAGL